MSENKPCQCGYDLEYLNSWSKLAADQVKFLVGLAKRERVERWAARGKPYHAEEAIKEHKKLFWQSTERVRHYQKLVQKSCKIDLKAANKNVFKAEEDVRNNNFRQADLELSEAELKVVVKLQQCAVR